MPVIYPQRWRFVVLTTPPGLAYPGGLGLFGGTGDLHLVQPAPAVVGVTAVSGELFQAPLYKIHPTLQGRGVSVAPLSGTGASEHPTLEGG